MHGSQVDYLNSKKEVLEVSGRNQEIVHGHMDLKSTV